MPPDPVVSPADTIRAAIKECDLETLQELSPKALDALDALLAVRERDRAEIERLRERLATTNRNWRVDWDQLVRGRERDRQQIARLTEALEAFADPRHWAVRRAAGAHVDAVWIGTYRQSPVDFARAVLADEEDAANG